MSPASSIVLKHLDDGRSGLRSFADEIVAQGNEFNVHQQVRLGYGCPRTRSSGVDATADCGLTYGIG
jgi:hypothetical protein